MTLQDLSLNLPEKQYHELPELSYSLLSRFDRDGYECLDSLFDMTATPSMVYGSLVDCLLTQERHVFDEMFKCDDGNVALQTGTNKEVLDYLIGHNDELVLASIPYEAILESANACNYYRTYKDETRVQKIYKTLAPSYNFIKQNPDKIAVSRKDLDDATRAAEVLRTHPLTRACFAVNGFNPFDPWERYYQLQFRDIDRKTGIAYKGMLDLTVVDRKAKVIYPYDLKTTKSIYTFEHSFYHYRYYIQAAMYTALLESMRYRCPELTDYTVAPYRFIVIDRNTFTPVIFEWTVSDEVAGPDGILRKPWRQLLYELNWALSHTDERLPVDWHESLSEKGVVTIKNYNDDYKRKTDK